jgi:hypothetical protein
MWSVDVIFNPLAVVPAESDVIPNAKDGLERWERVPDAYPLSLLLLLSSFDPLNVFHHHQLFYAQRLGSIEAVLASNGVVKRTHEPFKSVAVYDVGVRWGGAHVASIACSGHFSTPFLSDF